MYKVDRQLSQQPQDWSRPPPDVPENDVPFCFLFLCEGIEARGGLGVQTTRGWLLEFDSNDS